MKRKWIRTDPEKKRKDRSLRAYRAIFGDFRRVKNRPLKISRKALALAVGMQCVVGGYMLYYFGEWNYIFQAVRSAPYGEEQELAEP